MKCAITNFIALIFFVFNAYGVSVGSNSAVSRQGFVSFPASDSDNKMLGFASFENGFELESSLTTCTFDSLFPVGNFISLSYGTLYLLQDLVIAEDTVLDTMGSLYGSGNRFIWPDSKVTFSGTGSVVLDDLVFDIPGGGSWQIDMTVQNECTIRGAGKAFELENGGTIVVASGGCLTLQDCVILGVSGTNFSCEDNTASIVLKNCTLNLAGDFTFSKGSMLFEQDVVISGANQLTYSSVMASTIASESSLKITGDATFYYAPAIANRDLIYMTDESSCLHLDNCTLKSTSTGMRIINGWVVLDNLVTLSSIGSSELELICFDDVTICSGAWVDVHGGWSYNEEA